MIVLEQVLLGHHQEFSLLAQLLVDIVADPDSALVVHFLLVQLSEVVVVGHPGNSLVRHL